MRILVIASLVLSIHSNVLSDDIRDIIQEVETHERNYTKLRIDLSSIYELSPKSRVSDTESIRKTEGQGGTFCY